jgi:hypothetical protein
MSSPAGERPTGVSGANRATIVVIVSGDVELASWPFEAAARLDLSAVDELCRLGLAARRLGWSVRLRDVPNELWRLLELTGLASVAGPCAGALVVEVGGEPEVREEVGVEKRVEPGDPAI